MIIEKLQKKGAQLARMRVTVIKKLHKILKKYVSSLLGLGGMMRVKCLRPSHFKPVCLSLLI